MLDTSPERTVIESTPATLDDLYMTAQEVADRLRVDPVTLANLRARGEGIPYTKVTGRVLYKVADVLAAESEGCRGFNRNRFTTALETYGPLKKLTTAEREKLLLHVVEAMKG